eukprot:TRINITY_DN60779_c0_g1_i1.p1 TRINITY_DN60779_c0_g1~~TRINITY_DN60779_c0_g1_i1.p1  ORF type:complete len:552 (+),score=176.69 TRINITY_DN60779_c0_g1_i1:108-1658(+)
MPTSPPSAPRAAAESEPDIAAEFGRRRALAEQLLACGATAEQAEALTQLRVTCEREDLCGVYTLLPGELLQWARGEMRLVAGSGQCAGLWIFGDAAEVAEQRGAVRSAKRGCAVPLACTDWQESDGEGGWRSCGPLSITLAHSVDVLVQPRDMLSSATGEKLSLYNPDLDIEQGGRLVCHVCALTGPSRTAAEQGRLQGLGEYIRNRTAEVEGQRELLVRDRRAVLQAQEFFEKLAAQGGDYDRLRQQVRASIEAAVQYLRQAEEEELRRIDQMQRNNDSIVSEKLAEARDVLRQLNQRIATADAATSERHPPAFHRKSWGFLELQRREPIKVPPIELERPWVQRWRDPPCTAEREWDNHLPELHLLPLDRVVPPVGATVRVPTELLRAGDGGAARTDVGCVCVDGVFFELYLAHSAADEEGRPEADPAAGVFLHCGNSDPVHVQMDWSLSVQDIAGVPITETRAANGVFTGERAVGWHDAVPFRALDRAAAAGELPCVELHLGLSRVTRYATAVQ